jgi:hypothetical protein
MLKDARVPGDTGTELRITKKTDTVSTLFNGRDQYAYYDGKVISSYPFTIAAWIKTSSTDAQSPVGIYDATNDSRLWRIRIADGLPSIDASNPTLHSAASKNRIDDGLWHFVAAVFASSQRRELFVDGISQAVSTQSVNFSTNGATFVVGRTGGPKPSEYFRGKVNEVSVWSAALTTAAMRDLYNRGKPAVLTSNLGNYTHAANLASWWKMGDSGSDNFSLHLKDTRGQKHLRPFNLDSSQNATGDVP